jgi:hypothetical protein
MRAMSESQMLVPRWMVGDFKSARRRARDVARSVVAGASIDSMSHELVEMSTMSKSLIVVDGARHPVMGQHAFPHLIVYELLDAGCGLLDPNWERICAELLPYAWGIVSLVGLNTSNVLKAGKAPRCRLFLESVLRHWSTLTAYRQYSWADGVPMPFEKAAYIALLASFSFLGDRVSQAEVDAYEELVLPTIHARIVTVLEGRKFGSPTRLE